MSQSEHIADLAKALSKAQAKMAGARKEARNPHLHTRYADLASVWEACRGPLTENGLSVVQTLDDADCAENQICVVTTLLHESGQWIRSRLRMVASRVSRQGEQVDPQVIGSAITYARRYSLAAIVGVSPEDDDAETAMQRKAEKTTASVQTASRPFTPKTSRPESESPETQPPEVAAARQEAKQLANEILKLVHDGVLSSEDVKRHGDIPSVNEALKAGDVQRLRRAHRLVTEFVEARQASPQATATKPLSV